MKRTLTFLAFVLFSSSVIADMASDLRRLIGYTIIDSKTIAGWYDEDGKKGDSFEGCDYGRTIVFTDNHVLTCAEYGYHYSYRPMAIILAKGSSYKMIVDDEIYDMRR